MNIGTQLAIATWALTALSLLLVLLRLYTRIRIVRLLSAEDHMYWLSFLFLLAFASTLQIAVQRGLGTDFWVLTLDQSSDAIFWTYVANSFAILGNAMAKLSMGLFLLRVVQVRWHKIALWGLVGVTGGTSVALTVMLWCQTTPMKTSWDPIRTPGRWNIQIQPMSVGLGAWSSAVDFFFAIFPWLIIWSLKMPRREKMMLAGGMSLGVIAGVCGIIRTVVLARLDVLNYTLNFVPYFAWAGAEIAVSMVCLGIPTLRPLYLRARGQTIGYGSRSPTREDLPQFTMCEPKPGEATGLDTIQSDLPLKGQWAGGHDTPTVTTIDEEPQKIHWVGGRDTPVFTIDEEKGEGSREVVTRPASAHVAMGGPGARRVAAQKHGENNDSVEEILGLYGHDGQPAIYTWPRYQPPRAREPQWPLKD